MPFIPRFVVAAPSSGSGKSLVAAGLMAAFARKLAVQGFKVGPDYIDPMYHSAATGRPSRNLDTWMLPTDAVRAGFIDATAGVDLAIIEGVMGLFDGHDASPMHGSTAEVALLLQAPVVLVVDCGALSGSAGAIVHGFDSFLPGLRIAGVICNRVGGAQHGAWLREAIEPLGVPVLGLIPQLPDLVVPERHLGLFTVAERPEAVRRYLTTLAERIGDFVALDALQTLAHTAPALETPRVTAGREPGNVSPVRIAVARDEAFCFYYEDNLEALRRCGAEIVPFSPVHDTHLPFDIAGLYLGGGYPELYAPQLAANDELRHEILGAHRQGLPIYAECGGLMLLTEGIDLATGRYDMVGALPGRCTLSDRLRMGYREVETAQPGLLGPAGLRLRGHEFHHSQWEPPADGHAAYRIPAGASSDASRLEGYSAANLHASYVHLHLVQDPALPERLVDACRTWRAETRRAEAP